MDLTPRKSFIQSTHRGVLDRRRLPVIGIGVGWSNFFQEGKPQSGRGRMHRDSQRELAIGSPLDRIGLSFSHNAAGCCTLSSRQTLERGILPG